MGIPTESCVDGHVFVGGVKAKQKVESGWILEYLSGKMQRLKVYEETNFGSCLVQRFVAVARVVKGCTSQGPLHLTPSDSQTGKKCERAAREGTCSPRGIMVTEEAFLITSFSSLAFEIWGKKRIIDAHHYYDGLKQRNLHYSGPCAAPEA